MVSRILLPFERAEEKVFKGISGFGGGSLAVGRVDITSGKGETVKGEASMLCFFDGSGGEGTVEKLCGNAPAGVIVSSEAISSRLINLLICRRIPYLILKDGFSRQYQGKVALLDTEKDVLIIDPCLETLNSYPAARVALEACRLTEPSHRLLMRSRDGEAIMLDAEEARREGELFDVLAGIAEEYCGKKITVGQKLPLEEGDRERFCEDTEALFRAAVYGSFSVQLEGYSRPEDIRVGLELMHRVFCRLEAEGREFNGYLPRGVLLSAPVWLLGAPPFAKADFLTVDLDAAAAGLLGLSAEELGEARLPEETLELVWKELIPRFSRGCPLRAKSRILAGKEVLYDWISLMGIDELYIP